MLEESVEFLNSFRHGGISGDGGQNIFTCRTFLGRIVENFYSGPDKVASSLKKDGSSSECFAPLQFCGIFLRERTEIFLPAPPSHSANTPPLTKPDNAFSEEELTQAYLLWFLSRVLVLLGYEQCDKLHVRALDGIHHLLQTVKWRDSYLYSSLVRELILTVSDAVQINEQLCAGKQVKPWARFSVPMDKVLKSLQEPAKRSSDCEISLSQAQFLLDDINYCDLLQLNLMKVMRQLAGDLKRFCPEAMLNVLWACLCCHVEVGDACLKTESLHVLCLLMKDGCVPLEVENYFMDCVTALLHLLCSGVDGVESRLVEELEKACAHLINCMVSRGDNNLLSSYKTTMSSLLFNMADTLEATGLSRLRTRKMEVAVCRLIMDIQSCVPSEHLLGSSCRPARNQLMAALISEIGFHSDLQCIVGPLVQAVLADLTQLKGDRWSEDQPAALEPDIDTPKSGTTGLARNKRKRKLEVAKPPRTANVTSYSVTYKVLHTKLTRFLQQDLQDNSNLRTEGVWSVIEVITTCLSHYSSDASNNARQTVDVGRLSAWLSPTMCNELCGYMFHTMLALATSDRPRSDVNTCVTIILKIIGGLLIVQDCTDFCSDTYQLFGWLVSLPWLLNDPTWLDLKPVNTKDIVKIANYVVPQLETQTICRCLKVLVLLPKEVGAKWRVHVFRQALSESSIAVKQTAISAFPTLLYHLGANANHLVYDLLHPCIDESTGDTLRTLAATAGPLACVISRRTRTTRRQKLDLDKCLFESAFLGCSTCDSVSPSDLDGVPTKERPRLVDANMFSPFLQLKDCGKQSVKLALLGSIRRVFGHVGVRKNNAATISILNLALAVAEDSDYRTRQIFSDVVQYLVIDSSAEGSEGIPELVLAHLQDVYSKAQTAEDVRLQETALLTLAQLGRLCDGELMVVIIIVLLKSILSPVPLIAAVAYEQLKNIADYKKTKTQNLFMRCRLDVCKFLAESMHDAQLGKLAKPPLDILTQVSKVLGFPDVKTFLSGTEKYIVPYLVSKGTAAASSVVKLLATQLSIASRSKLLINNTKYVFSYLVRHKQKETELQTAIHYLQKETKFELRNLLRIDFQRVHNELLLHLSSSYSQVFHGLKILSTCDEQYEPGREITSNDEMAAYLQPRLLGVLAHFDSQLLNSNIPMEEKRPALESLISIMRLMGSKIISTIRHKVMNTLRIGLQFTDKAFINISCRAWNCFVRSLELTFLGQMLAQIIATLLPLLKQMPKQVADMFTYMIVDNRNALKTHFHDIYFLPDIPELHEANAVLKQYTDGPSSQSDFSSRLVHSMRGIQHESLDVRLHGLSKLKNLLKEEREAFFQLVMENETADPIVSQLVSLLLKGCREPDAQAQRLYVECLGNCSAIDPGRLELSTNNPKAQMAKFHASIQDDNFAVAVINEMVKSYLAATEPRIQDCSAFALQELLSIYKIEMETSGEDPTSKLWHRFPEYIQEVLRPLLSSRYILASADHNWSHMHKPIYCSKKGNSFKDWVSTWTGYLSSKIKTDSKPYRVFKSCSAVIKFDSHIALYILPYVVLHVLQDGSETDVNEIVAEITEVLNQVTRTDGMKQKGSADFHHMSAQTVFSVLDYLTRWKHFQTQLRSGDAHTGKQGVTKHLTDMDYKVVSDFLAGIPQDKLATVSFSCKAYTRALMHFEQHITKKTTLSKEDLDFMQRLYVALDEPDGVLGVAAMRQATPTLQEQILTYSGRQGCQIELQTCYEQAIQYEPDELKHHQGLLRCLMDLGQPSQAMHHASGVIAKRKVWSSQVTAYQVEAAWKLGNWTDLETYIKADKEGRRWPVVLGKILLSAKDKKEEDFLQQLRIARQDQMGPLSAASMEMGSYQRGYEYIARLHMLNEIEENVHVFMGFPPGDDHETRTISEVDLLAQSSTKLKMMQSSFRIQEPLLTMRRTLMMLAQREGDTNLDREIGHSWLTSAKIAQKTGYLQTAYSFLLQASEFNLPEFCLQKAKWLSEKGENDQALLLLEREMQLHFSNVSLLKADNSEEGKAKRYVYAKALLLYGRYCEEASNLESNAIVKQYREVIDVAGEWEDGYFYLGKYFDKIMTTLIDDKDDMAKQGEFVVHVVKNLGQSLRYGNQFIYQSLPRMLSLWMDFGTAVVDMEKRDRSRVAAASQALQKGRTNLVKLNTMIASYGKSLAPYQLFSAFSQLISRICHAQVDVFTQLKTIIARLVVNFPQQALWLLMAVSKSSYKMRALRCQEIFATAKEMEPNLTKVIQDHIRLTERLLELCEKDFPGLSTLSLVQHFRPLKRLLEDSSFSRILLPLQSSMTVTLPNKVDSSKQHNAFPRNLVYIKGFEDVIEILPSLQKPKKITMIGSDGRLYVMMCKPKDDLRKDCRLMEFNGIVNKFLRKDPESRKRSLNIRTYTVIPLNEECGLIEWVNNTSGLRYILMKLYREKGLYTSGKELKAMMPQLQATKETKLAVYKQKLLPRHPPVFGEWFLRTFPDPTSWYNARLAYCKTVAVMSMVGYMLGLGDRHGENILFDSTTGDCCHVDFNCLFNRGETFEWAEKVPFRLTHNLIHAMGPLKLEGIFRRACEVTLRVMRKETDPLMSILKPFVYDPLVEWSKPARGQRQNPTDTGEITNEQARVHVQNIEHRLQGILNRGSKRSGLALSVEGHVNYLIQEATDENNLCLMYIGWAAYL